MKSNDCNQKGFTLIELLSVVAVIAILSALAVTGYQQYTGRARGTDIIEKYDAIRTSVAARERALKTDDCAELAKGFDATNLVSPHVTLAYGFEAVSGGYRPVLTVCAQAGDGPLGLMTARGTYDTLLKTGVVESGAVITDTLVSFALNLTPDNLPLCRTAPAQPAAVCGQTSTPVAVQPTVAPLPQLSAQQAPVPSTSPSQPASAQAVTCPSGQTMMTVNINGKWQRACAPTCPAGQRLNGGANQCIPDSGTGNQPASGGGQSNGNGQAGLSPQDRQLARAAEQKLAQTIGQAATVDDAISATLAAAQGLPPGSLTQSISGNTPVANRYRATCNLPQVADGKCEDKVVGNLCATTLTSATPSCTLAIMCPKTIGLCQGVTPEMKRQFDASMQRIVNDWFTGHPGCTEFGQTGC